MFTGIVQSIGTIRSVRRHGPDLTVVVDPGRLDPVAIQIGDSVAVDGVCLTVVAKDHGALQFDVSAETISRSLLATVGPGDRVNLELALSPTSRLGGHFVTGHVDGLGRLVERKSAGRSVAMRFDTPAHLSRYIAEKGSISINGVSLTVNRVIGSAFEVNIVPHTLRETTLGSCIAGQPVHIEVDLIARYVERLLNADRADSGDGMGKEFLSLHGFVSSEGGE